MNSTVKKSEKRSELETALKTIAGHAETMMSSVEDEVSLGWVGQNVGDFVYFKTYDDGNDVITVSKGEIIEVITSEKKVMNKPDDNMKSEGWHNERTVMYKIRWNGMTATVDSRYVYEDKLKAIVAAISYTVKSYFDK